MPRPSIYVIHENDEWLAPLRQAFEALGTPYEEWFLDELALDLRSVPPEGIFFSRMSASNYTRGHHHATQSTDLVLRWLEWHGRRVINASSVLRLEMSKAAQHMLLSAAGLHTPQTVVAVGRTHIANAARQLGLSPFILKPNQGGKGLGVMLFDSIDELQQALAGGDIPQAADDVWLLQERIATDDAFITRIEFIGGRFHYAVRVFGGGSFELCPADVCEVGPGEPGSAEARGEFQAVGPRFEIDIDFDDAVIGHLEAFLAANAIEIAGVEFIRRPDGTVVIYDVNTNTNYNAQAESRAGVKGGMRRIAEFLSTELATVSQRRQDGEDVGRRSRS
jgi:hypothetical protein